VDLYAVGDSKFEGVGVQEPDEREERAIWRADPKIEPTGLDIGETNGAPPAGGGGDLYAAGESGFEAVGVQEPGEREEEAIWHADPKIERDALDIGGTNRAPPAGGGVDLYAAGDSEFEVVGVREPGERDEGAIWRADPKIEPSGLDISGTNGVPLASGGVDLYAAGEREFEGLGVLEHGVHEWGVIWRA
jgi:hypothetical protein